MHNASVDHAYYGATSAFDDSRVKDSFKAEPELGSWQNDCAARDSFDH